MAKFWNTQDAEQRMLWYLLAVSFAAHFFFLIFDQRHWLERAPLFEEWEIQAELMMGPEGAIPDMSSLPKAEEADEARVPENMLPQLSKTFAINSAEKQDEVDAEEGKQAKEDEKSETLVDKKDEQMVAPSNQENTNKIDQEDAIRRSALEKLREEEKFSKKLQAEKSDALARLRSDVKSAKDVKVGGAAGTGTADANYSGRLKGQVKKCYSLPTAYNMQDSKMKVEISIVLGEMGNLISSTIVSSSGDKVFDALAFKAVQDCSPLPAPPKARAGKPIILTMEP